jgi:hypothetical protein
MKSVSVRPSTGESSSDAKSATCTQNQIPLLSLHIHMMRNTQCEVSDLGIWLNKHKASLIVPVAVSNAFCHGDRIGKQIAEIPL